MAKGGKMTSDFTLGNDQKSSEGISQKEELFQLLGQFEISRGKQFERRNDGKKTLLKGTKKELEFMLGLKSGRNSKIPFGLFANKITQNQKELLTPCLLYEDFQIQKEVCNWCTHRRECDSTEQRSYTRLEYQFRTRNKDSEKVQNDRQTIEEWLNNERNLIRHKHMIFSDNEDPFLPSFGRQSDRKIMIIPNAEMPPSNVNNSSSWAHEFYSRVLGRTLTFFESIIIQNLPKRTDFKEGGAYISIEQVRENFYSDGIKTEDVVMEEMKKRESCSDSPKSLSLRMCFEEMISEGKLLPREKNTLFDLILTKSEEIAGSGIFGREEIFAGKPHSSRFDLDFMDFIWEVYSKVTQLDNELDVNTQFVSPKEACILLHGPKCSKISLPMQYQIIRICEIDGLHAEWAMLDEEKFNPEGTSFDRRPLEIRNHFLAKEKTVSKWLVSALEAKGGVTKHIENSFNLVHWTAENIHAHNGTRVNFFPPGDIFSAYAMQRHLTRLRMSSVAPSNRRWFRKVDSIFTEIFFKHRHDVKDPKIEAAIKGLSNEIGKPEHRKLHPREMIINIAKNKKFRQLIHWHEDPDGTDTQNAVETQQITLYPGGKGNSGEKNNPIFLRRAIKKPTYGDYGRYRLAKFKTFTQPLWSTYHPPTTQESSDRHHAVSTQLREVLNWVPDTSQNEMISQRHVWFSTQIHALLDIDSIHRWKFIRAVQYLLKKDGVDGVLFFARQSEIAEIESILGRVFIKKVTISEDKEYQDIVFWKPEGPAGRNSLHFLQTH